ncbi:MAG: hypothetical protein NTZ10_01980 [Candidatus Saganbacteria bacterium]|nr:hypothetical protein [Candidatus Saganbacteria bacterium]
MNKLLKLFDKNKLTLIVSLPDNSPDLAKAAVAGGADALKVHINIKHQASGVTFGSLDQEGPNLEKILKAAKIPVGIVPGNEKKPSEKEMQEIIKMGFDFFDMNINQMPPFMLGLKGITKVAAIDGKDASERLVTIKEENCEAIEAAIIPHLGYGQNLTIGDLQYYISIAITSQLPVIVPTQRKIGSDEVPIIAETGVKSLMIGAIVTGKTAKMIEQATRDYRKAIDKLE